jgi:hypothetical protein
MASQTKANPSDEIIKVESAVTDEFSDVLDVQNAESYHINSGIVFFVALIASLIACSVFFPEQSLLLRNAVSLFFSGMLWLVVDSTNEEERDILKREFEQEYGFGLGTIDISSIDGGNLIQKSANTLLFGSDSILSVKNNSELDWENIFLIVNPKNQTITDSVKFTLAESGFRCPEQGSYFVSLASQESIEIPLDRFVHIDTQEKFSTARYKLNSVFIKADVQYKGRSFPCDSTLAW